MCGALASIAAEIAPMIAPVSSACSAGASPAIGSKRIGVCGSRAARSNRAQGGPAQDSIPSRPTKTRLSTNIASNSFRGMRTSGGRVELEKRPARLMLLQFQYDRLLGEQLTAVRVFVDQHQPQSLNGK